MKRILVVDDDPDIRESVSYILRKAGFAVDTAANGAEALAVMRERRPDAVFLDLMMPVMDGNAFLEACRQDASCAEVPVALMSATPGAAQGARNVAACLTKPFGLAEALAVANRLTREGVPGAVSVDG